MKEGAPSAPIDCVVSIVTFKNPPEMVLRVLQCCLETSLAIKIYVIDNSPTPSLRESLENFPVHYHFTGHNLGFGRAHNWALHQKDPCRYRLILNPDVQFKPGTLESLTTYLDQNPRVGLVTPRVLNPDGTLQDHRRNFPTPWVLFGRRFFPRFVRKRWRGAFDHDDPDPFDMDGITDVSWLSGCFLLIRSEAFQKAGGFDERFFMYMEDVDLCRRIGEAYRLVSYPKVQITHNWGRGSYHSLRLLMIHVWSAVKYFNKWGWTGGS